MAEQIKFGDRLFLAGEKVILDNGKDTSPILEARNGELIIGYNTDDVQAKDHHVLIKGDLTVEGTMTSIQTVDTIIKDNIIVLNEGETGSGIQRDSGTSGLKIDRGTETYETFLFDEAGWLGSGGIDVATDAVRPSWLSSTLSLTDDLSAENIYARTSLTVNGELSVTGNAGIDGDTNIGGNANVTGNVEVIGHITASSTEEHQIGDFTFNQSVMSVVSEQMEIRSPGGISFYPDADNSNPVQQGGEKIVWLRDGAKLVFEGTIPDDYEVKLQATDITADRDIVLPDESGTLALQEWTTRKIDEIKTRISDIPPENPLVGNLWWNSNTGRLKIYYQDVDSSQWVDAIPATGTVTQQLPTNENGDIIADLSNYYNILQIDNIISNIELTPGPEGPQGIQGEQGPPGPPGEGSSVDLTPYALKTYVDTSISNLVNGADGAFDTLKEIQDAMATDTELSSAISNLSIPTDVSDLTDTNNLLNNSSFSGSYNDLTDKPTLFSGVYTDLVDKPTIPTDVSDLTDNNSLLNSGGGTSLPLTYDDTTKTITSNNVESGGAPGSTSTTETFINLLTPVASISLASDTSQYLLGNITVDNGVDAQYILSSNDYTHSNGVINFNNPVIDGQVQENASITTGSVNSQIDDIIIINGVSLIIQPSSQSALNFSLSESQTFRTDWPGYDTNPLVSWIFSDGTTTATVDVAGNVGDLQALSVLVNEISFMESYVTSSGTLIIYTVVEQLTWTHVRGDGTTTTSVYDSVTLPTNSSIREQINARNIPGVTAVASSSNTLTISSSTVDITITEQTPGAMSRLGFANTSVTSTTGIVDQDGLVSIEVELLSTAGYVNLGSSEKPFKTLYVDEIHLTTPTTTTLPVLEVHVHDLSDDDMSPTIMDVETYSGVYITGTNTISIHPINYIKIPDGTVSGQRFFWFNDGSQVVLTINGSNNSGHAEGEYVWTGSVWKKL